MPQPSDIIAPREAHRLRPAERRALLDLARTAIGARLGLADLLAVPAPPPALLAPAGAFVTLHLAGELRGCVGTVLAVDPLHETVQRVACSAAFGDPRFAPLTAAEWPPLQIEISHLSPPRRIDAGGVVAGRHGVYVVHGPTRGLLLPQVATEHGWDAARLLSEACGKAALPPDAWRDPATEIYVFEAEVFGDGTEAA